MAVLCQSLDALTSVHQKNITHRDIKPENFLVQSRIPLHIKLSDFGLAKATSNLETRCGTPSYMAPEIVERSDTFYTKACDIWSLGVVVYKYNQEVLPDTRNLSTGITFCLNIVQHMKYCQSDPLNNFLRTRMVIMNPERRLSAEDCWKQALAIFGPAPTQVSDHERTMKRKKDPTNLALSSHDNQSNTPIHGAQHSSSSGQQPKPKRARHDLDLQHP